MAFPPEQRVFIVESYIKGRSYKLCRQLFVAKYPGIKPPAKATIQKLVEKFRSTGSILNVAKERSKTALTLNKLNEINERLQACPGKSLRRLSAQTGVSYASVHRATKLLGSKDFKMAAGHELRPADRARRLEFSNWIFGQIAEGLLDPGLLFFSDEAWFHSNGYVTSQHERWWAPENPHHLHEVPLPEFKVGVWCAVSSRRVVGPIFFYEALDSERYVANVLHPFLGQLTEQERAYGWFQQDHVLGRTVCKSPAVLRGTFEARIIGRKHWPPRSPDLNACSFFLWGYLKDRVYQNYPCTAGALEENIRGTVRNIPTDVLEAQVFSEFMRRNQLCLQEKGNQFQHLLEGNNK